ncbi:MAG: hypothetical protein HKM89_09575, partial [Gemmatimonadales bacterium]|nr:hypothetical protein [Gemmatimonadales bacterium]
MAVPVPWVERKVVYRFPRRDTLPLHPGPEDTDLATFAVAELSRLDPNVTSALWHETNPLDTLEFFEPKLNWLFERETFESDWCMRARRRVLLDGVKRFVATRTAFFYPPPASSPPALPPARHDPAFALSHCRLGAVAVTAHVRDEETADSLALEIRSTFGRRLGAGVYDGDYENWDADRWNTVSHWKRGNLNYFAYYRRLRPDTVGVTVVAWVPGSNIRVEPYPDWCSDEGRDRARLEDVLRESDLASPLAAQLLELTRTAQYCRSHQEREWSDSLLLASVREWVARADTMSPPRRATALLLFDQLMAAGARLTEAHQRDGGAMRDTLLALGVEWTYMPISHEYNYAGNIKWEVRRLDEHGPAGRLALLYVLRDGLDTPVNTGTLGAHRVIAEGTRYLEGNHPGAEPWLMREVHELVAVAYGDVLTMAVAPTTEISSVDPPDTIPPHRAREEAVRHYAAALALADETSSDATKLWRAGWRLA